MVSVLEWKSASVLRATPAIVFQSCLPMWSYETCVLLQQIPLKSIRLAQLLLQKRTELWWNF